MQKKRARERIIMFLCIISLLFTPVLAASQSNAMRVSLDLKSATVKEFFDAVKVQTGLNFIYSTEQVKNMPRITIQSNSPSWGSTHGQWIMSCLMGRTRSWEIRWATATAVPTGWMKRSMRRSHFPRYMPGPGSRSRSSIPFTS